MKLYTVIEIPDEDYELSDKWCLDCDGDIEYFSKKDNCWKTYYKTSIDDCSLRPLPQKIGKQAKHILAYSLGWNACIDEITGETE